MSDERRGIELLGPLPSGFVSVLNAALDNEAQLVKRVLEREQQNSGLHVRVLSPHGVALFEKLLLAKKVELERWVMEVYPQVTQDEPLQSLEETAPNGRDALFHDANIRTVD